MLNRELASSLKPAVEAVRILRSCFPTHLSDLGSLREGAGEMFAVAAELESFLRYVGDFIKRLEDTGDVKAKPMGMAVAADIVRRACDYRDAVRAALEDEAA